MRSVFRDTENVMPKLLNPVVLMDLHVSFATIDVNKIGNSLRSFEVSKTWLTVTIEFL